MFAIRKNSYSIRRGALLILGQQGTARVIQISQQQIPLFLQGTKISLSTKIVELSCLNEGEVIVKFQEVVVGLGLLEKTGSGFSLRKKRSS